MDTIRVNAPLSLTAFQKISHQRNVDKWKDRSKDWGLVDWSNAIAGEAGELCNRVKKVRRGDVTLEEAKSKILAEAADVITYVMELCSFLGVNASEELLRTFNEVSARPDVQFPPIRIVHSQGCPQHLSRFGAVAIECEHGRDSCPICDHCTCI